jgi:hypothetical protein
MMRKTGTILAGACASALVAGIALAQGGGGEATTAVYWMTADTMSGMGGMMGRSTGSMLGQMMRGGGMGGGTAKILRLQLGSTRRANGAPEAEHLPPAALLAGQSLPLVTPEQARATPEAGPTDWTQKMERPKGRILIYWGCGEHARPGQPYVIDFESLSQGRMPPAFANLMAARNAALPPSPDRSATYGEWPNRRSSTRINGGASLVGEHVVRGNYTPDIRFTVAPGQDFLAPVALTANTAAPSGAVPLVWQPISGARGWLLTAMGGGQSGDLVIWTSSEVQAMAMGMDHMSDGEIARLVQQRVLLPGAADRCTVPAEVAHAGRGAMLTVTAFGGEHNFSSPVRPARAPASWRPDWLVKLRVKASYMGLLGMDMSQMGMGGDERSGRDQNGDGQPQPKKKKSIFDRALGGVIPH